jgi:hypothetical protein
MFGYWLRPKILQGFRIFLEKLLLIDEIVYVILRLINFLNIRG